MLSVDQVTPVSAGRHAGGASSCEPAIGSDWPVPMVGILEILEKGCCQNRRWVGHYLDFPLAGNSMAYTLAESLFPTLNCDLESLITRDPPLAGRALGINFISLKTSSVLPSDTMINRGHGQLRAQSYPFGSTPHARVLLHS